MTRVESFVICIEHLLKDLSEEERCELMYKIEEKYCQHCWRELPKDTRCQCWNDE